MSRLGPGTIHRLQEPAYSGANVEWPTYIDLSSCARETIFDDEIKGGKDNRVRFSLSERRDFLSTNLVRGVRRHLPLEKKVVSLKTTLSLEASIQGIKWPLTLELARTLETEFRIQSEAGMKVRLL